MSTSPTDETPAANSSPATAPTEPPVAAPVAAPTDESLAPAAAEPEAAASPSEPAPASPPAPSSARTIIKLTPDEEAYVPGQCTLTVALTLLPDDGHADGRLVIIGVASHAEVPVIGTTRLSHLQLPPEISDLITRYEASLPARGQAQTEKLAKEKSEKESAEARRKEAEEKRLANKSKSKAKTAKTASTPTSSATTSPAAPSTATSEAEVIDPASKQMPLLDVKG